MHKAVGLRPEKGDRPFVIIFLTDGLPTVGNTDENHIVESVTKASESNVRVFCFGIGTDVNTHLLDRIAVDPALRFGKPCVRGTRISVGDVLGYLAGGMSQAQILADFPQLTSDDVRACLAYAAERERRTLTTPAA